MFNTTNAGNSKSLEEHEHLANDDETRSSRFSSYKSKPFSSLPRGFSSSKNRTKAREEYGGGSSNERNENINLRDSYSAKSLSRLNTLNYDNAAIELNENSFQSSGLDVYPQQNQSSGDISIEMNHLQSNRHENEPHSEISLSDLSWQGDGSDEREYTHSSASSEASYSVDDATREVLTELDTILDIHGATQLTLQTKVEDCLLDLDNYLEEMDDYSFNNNDDDDDDDDRSSLEDEAEAENSLSPPNRLPTRQSNRSLPISRKKMIRKKMRGESEGRAEEVEREEEERHAKKGLFERMQPMRRTITSTKEKKYEDLMENLERTPLEGARLPSEEAFTELFITEADESVKNTNLQPPIMDAWSDLHVSNASEPMVVDQQRSLANMTLFEESDNNFNTEQHSSINTSLGEMARVSNDTARMENGRTTAADDVPPIQTELRRCYSQNRLSTTSTNSRSEMLTQDDIFKNLLLQNDNNNSDTLENRPRQFGRRASGHPPVLSIRPDILEGNHSFGLMDDVNRRPQSAPAIGAAARQACSIPATEVTHSHFSASSDVSSAHTSRNSSPITIVSSTDSASTSASTNGHTAAMNLVSNGHYEQSNTERNNNTSHASLQCANNEWPHMCSRALALVCCTVGLFNMSRFAVLTIEYGGNFVLQFFLLSILFGIPLFLLHICLGARIKAGPISMWKISPICRGIGIALILVQFFIAIYSTAAVAWLLVYLRDTIPNKGYSGYLWQERISPYKQTTNTSANFTEIFSDYFNVAVLQRLHLIKSTNGGGIRFRVNNRLTFNLAIIWAAVFLILCRGLKSFGKGVFLLTILPLIALVAVICKLLYAVDPEKLQNIFTTTDLSDFFENSRMWAAAAQEVFLTWGLLGSSVISITSCTYTAGRSEISLRRDAIFAILLTLFSILIVALFGMLCLQIINQNSYIYMPGSFETLESSKSIFSPESITNTNIRSIAYKWMPHYSSFIGEIYRRQTSQQESGYQALRFINEILPATLTLSGNSVSWVWATVTLSAFIVLGLSQLCAMWKPISSALGNSTSAVLLSCVTGLLLGVPFTTEIGISILYYMDLVLGGSWFVAILWTAQIFGVFLIRGRPYNGDDLVNNLNFNNTLSAFTALAWNVLLPIGLITLSVVSYKTSFSSQFYYWRGTSYFTYWARKVAAAVQIGFLLLVPVTAIIQIYRYLTNGPPDILDRIQLLYRPGEGLREIRNSSSCDRSRTDFGRSEGNGTIGNLELNPYQAHDDAPPKYTPPPSYTTATGARLAKILRQSIRRSVRRVLGDRGRARPILTIDSESNQQPTTSLHSNEANVQPNYSCADINITNTALTPIQHQHQNFLTGVTSGEHIQRSLSLGRKLTVKQQYPTTTHHTIGGGGRGQRPNTTGGGQRGTRAPYTADDVVTVLRSTAHLGAASSSGTIQTARPETVAIVSPSTPEACELSSNNYSSFRSIENLVTNAAPMARSAALAGTTLRREDVTNKSGSNTSVI